MACNVYFTADPHLGHAKVSEVRGFGSVDEHDEWVIDTLASTACSKRDTLWILGDIAFGKHNLQKLKAIPALMKIVLGNHDSYAIEHYLEITNRIYGAFTFKGDILLTHVPVARQQSNRFRLNVHGHLHRNYIDDLFYLNVGIDYGRPFSTGEIYDARDNNNNAGLHN